MTPQILQWQKEMPDSVGHWYMRCDETDFKTSSVEVFMKSGYWMVDDHWGIGEAGLEHYHSGLTDIEWCKASDSQLQQARKLN